MDRAIPFWFRAVQFGKTFVHGQRLAFFWPVRAHNPNGSTIGSVIFAQITAECPYTLQWDAPFSLKIAVSHEGICTLSNAWFPGSTRVLNPNDISIGSDVFAGLTSVTDRPTHHASRSVTIDRIYVGIVWAMRSNNKMYANN